MRTVFTHLFWELMPYGRDVADQKRTSSRRRAAEVNVKLRDRTIGIFIGSVSTFQAIVAPLHSADFRPGVAADGARLHLWQF